MEWFDKLLYPIKVVVAWIMYGWHELFVQVFGMDEKGGLGWALSIVGLVIMMRTLLIPLFVRQIRAQRGLQLISPELQAIQKKYKGKSDPASREAMSRETMELYRKHGTNPFSSCLPILAQSPIFFALFRVLYRLPDAAAGNYPTKGAGQSIGPIDAVQAGDATNATLFGAPISSSFLNPITARRDTTADTDRDRRADRADVGHDLHHATTAHAEEHARLGDAGPDGAAAEDAAVCAAPHLRDLWRELPDRCPDLLDHDEHLVDGSAVLRHPTQPDPGSEAERVFKERQARKAAAKGIILEDDRPAIEENPRGQRQQPKRKAGPRTPPAAPAAPAERETTSRTRPRTRPRTTRLLTGLPRRDRPAGRGRGRGRAGGARRTGALVLARARRRGRPGAARRGRQPFGRDPRAAEGLGFGFGSGTGGAGGRNPAAGKPATGGAGGAGAGAGTRKPGAGKSGTGKSGTGRPAGGRPSGDATLPVVRQRHAGHGSPQAPEASPADDARGFETNQSPAACRTRSRSSDERREH